MENKLAEAVAEYCDRIERRRHPSGSFDKQRRWYPDENEKQICCASIRRPSAAFPFSLNKHCRSVQHVATLYSVAVTDLRRAATQELNRRAVQQRFEGSPCQRSF